MARSLYGVAGAQFPRQNEREETTQDIIVTKSAAYASYKSNYVAYITATYTRAKRRWLGTLSLRCNGVPTASQTAAVEIKL